MKLTIKNKLIFAFALLIGFIIIVFVLATISLSGMNDRISYISNNTAAKILLTGEINQDIIYLSRDLKNVIISTDDQQMKDIVQGIDRKKNELSERINNLDELLDSEEKAILNEFKKKWEEYLVISNNIVALALQNSNPQAAKISMEQAGEYYDESIFLLNQIKEETKSNSSAQFITSNLLEALSKIVRAEKNIIFATTDEKMSYYNNVMTENRQLAERYADELNSQLSGRSARIFEKFEVAFNKYTEVNKEIISLSLLNTNEKAFILSNTTGNELHQESLALMQQLTIKCQNQLINDKIESKESYTASNIYMIITIVLSILLSTLIAFWIVRGIIQALDEAKKVAQEVAEGNFSTNINITNDDEIGDLQQQLKYMVDRLKNSAELAKRVAAGDLTVSEYEKHIKGDLDEALKEMIERLRSVVSSIMNGADNIAAASQQMSDGAQQLSQGAQEQATSSEEVSSSMEQMAANIDQNTDNARQTEKIARKADVDIKDSSEVVNETVLSIETIAEKITIIREIAEKTDLLALNAAVEAARAGEYGKGFAVVAAEVRKLAERSQKAANEIGELSSASVIKARESGKKLQLVVPDIQKTAELVQEISAASTEQSSGAEQVNKAIQQLSQVIQKNAANSEEIASSSEELSSQADELKKAVGYFKLDNNFSSKSNSSSLVKRHNSKNRSNATKIVHEPSTSKGVDLDLGDESPSFDNFGEF
ncbi:HAMP domain-containing methyl-accepting chemotaxis protein [Chondrinema litorale]|uniref:HAMP domain-containing methyl-accepting chemotaxis protein n=1 Tax=Chondrinema litorale TaxID=2994555 RepID=UPI0025435539|nr:methyl-accepting chemotaxis protein [Chondrinema litorale]UZR98389.1 methyl-accepting chemotaxis protein [Chondrinema litorale]